MADFPKIIHQSETVRIVRAKEDELIIESNAGQDGLGNINWKKSPLPVQIASLKDYILARLRKIEAKKKTEGK